MTPLEKAARALAKVQSGTDEWDAYDQAFQETLIEAVRAVLQAIREPSEGMIEAALLRETEWDTDSIRRECHANAWVTMIDAALTE
jgi:hypothetical protein